MNAWSRNRNSFHAALQRTSAFRPWCRRWLFRPIQFRGCSESRKSTPTRHRQAPRNRSQLSSRKILRQLHVVCVPLWYDRATPFASFTAKGWRDTISLAPFPHSLFCYAVPLRQNPSRLITRLYFRLHLVRCRRLALKFNQYLAFLWMSSKTDLAMKNEVR